MAEGVVITVLTQFLLRHWILSVMYTDVTRVARILEEWGVAL